MSEDIHKFQEAGDVCSNCEERWKERKKATIKLVALPSFTMRYHSPVAACPYCDGPIHKIAVAAAKGREADATNE